MSEATFARTFLTTLDSRPIKLSPDHVEDPKGFPARPAYILPRMPTSMSKPTSAVSSGTAPGQERSITVTLRSLRNPPLDIKLTSQPLGTSLLDIKNAVSKKERIPVDKLKLLHNKRPLQDSKILRDLLGGEDAKSIEITIMVIGGAAAVLPAEGSEGSSSTTATVAGEGLPLLETKEFWSDLNGFLMQRLKDEALAKELSALFKSSWQSQSSRP